jgi:pSer/pThr/pTyr-binding forkhead associated (FHA) protein
MRMTVITEPSSQKRESSVNDVNRGAVTASETIDESALNATSLTVRLVVGAGNHAGVAADIRHGLYMIGRHRECQIRPKSQSVSERHCLVHHQAGAVRVFDLDSDQGTFVNDIQVPPKIWQLLNHGDRLRCGRYWFEVAIYLPQLEEEIESVNDSVGEDLLSQPTVTDEVFEVGEADLFADDNFGPDLGSGLEESGVDEAGEKKESSTPAKPRKKSRYSSLPKPKIKKSYSSGAGFSLSFGSVDSWKAIVAVLATVLVVGYLGWSIYKIQKGPAVKIVQGVD